MGYEIAGVFVRHRVPLDALPPGDDTLPARRGRRHGPRRRRDPRRVPRVGRDIDRTRRTGHRRPLARPHPAARPTTTPGARSWSAKDGRITGFASFTRETEPGPLDVAFGLDCRALFAVDTHGAARALAYFRGYRGLGTWLQWVGPPNDPIALGSLDAFVERPYRYDWMLRLLDVPAALEQRGYPAIDVEATFAVDDPTYPDNAGPWRLIGLRWAATVGGVRGPRPAADPDRRRSPRCSPDTSAPTTPSGSGYLDADDPAVEALAAMFAGPDPWCPFFF